MNSIKLKSLHCIELHSSQQSKMIWIKYLSPKHVCVSDYVNCLLVPNS
jgi:hypothetical protein